MMLMLILRAFLCMWFENKLFLFASSVLYMILILYLFIDNLKWSNIKKRNINIIKKETKVEKLLSIIV